MLLRVWYLLLLFCLYFILLVRTLVCLQVFYCKSGRYAAWKWWVTSEAARGRGTREPKARLLGEMGFREINWPIKPLSLPRTDFFRINVNIPLDALARSKLRSRAGDEYDFLFVPTVRYSEINGRTPVLLPPLRRWFLPQNTHHQRNCTSASSNVSVTYWTKGTVRWTRTENNRN